MRMISSPEQTHSSHTGQSETAPPAIQASHLVKHFDNTPVLKDVSLDVPEGSVTAIIGASGSGKSTLLRCMNLLEQPDRGSLEIAGESFQFNTHFKARPADLEQLRTRVTMVFQQFNLWPHLSVLGNVIEAPRRVKKMPRKDAIALGDHYLEKVGMLDKRDAYPRTLSGGQQQRIAIARALAMEPQILLFDEPTSALDPELVSEVLSVIRDLADEGRTMLLVTHEMSFARDVSDQVVFLDHGEIQVAGPPEAVFNDPRCRKFASPTA